MRLTLHHLAAAAFAAVLATSCVVPTVVDDHGATVVGQAQSGTLHLVIGIVMCRSTRLLTICINTCQLSDKLDITARVLNGFKPSLFALNVICIGRLAFPPLSHPVFVPTSHIVAIASS
jgi:hypothetical protein